MPKRTDIRTILVVGSGPIIIGQACEFDYSGAQACKVLREEGYRIVLVNSNPATIMTDPGLADRTYVEPITAEFVEKIISKEKPDALLPTLGGQTALNVAVELAESGVLERYGVEMIGCSLSAIQRGENRRLFNAPATIFCSLQTRLHAGITSSRNSLRTMTPGTNGSAIRTRSVTIAEIRGSQSGLQYEKYSDGVPIIPAKRTICMMIAVCFNSVTGVSTCRKTLNT